MEQKHFEVIIIGGSYSGLSAAMSLGRSLRQVLVIDSGLPCNRQTPHSHNFITQDGEKPAVISVKAKLQVDIYKTVQFYNGLAVKALKTESEGEKPTFLAEFAHNNYKTNLPNITANSNEEILYNYQIGGSFGAYLLDWIEKKFPEYHLMK